MKDDTPMERHMGHVMTDSVVETSTIKLAKKSIKVNLPFTTHIGAFESNSNYISLNPEDDYDIINESIDIASRFHKLDEDPPVIVAGISRRSGSIPQWYYIRRDLLETTHRKKKSAKSKPKRKVCRCKK